MTVLTPEIVDYIVPLILGAVGVLLMLPVTITLYRRFLSKPIAEKTKHTFLDACNDANFVGPMKETLLWHELTRNNLSGVESMNAKVAEVVKLPDAMNQLLEKSEKKMGEYFAQNFETMGAVMSKELAGIKQLAEASRNLVKANPGDAQGKSVESRRVNQIVGVLEDAAIGPSITAKARELGDFLSSVGQPDLADWLEENQEAVMKVERRIRANPQLAARLQQYQQRLTGGRSDMNAAQGSRGGEL